jgi:hypothetical protein
MVVANHLVRPHIAFLQLLSKHELAEDGPSKKLETKFEIDDSIEIIAKMYNHINVKFEL